MPKLMAVVDYAHTPDALEKALDESCVSILRGSYGVCLVVVVIETKANAPMMGEIASRLADKVVITADNPRTEAVGQILDEIVQGLWLTALIG
jgi:UDP-N-acetylmuramoyl-L-alanyl-D-glutamate--2,6-diaminopimelate ligase